MKRNLKHLPLGKNYKNGRGRLDKGHSVAIRFTPEQHEKILEIARCTGLSFASVVRFLIQSHFENRKDKKCLDTHFQL